MAGMQRGVIHKTRSEKVGYATRAGGVHQCLESASLEAMSANTSCGGLKI